MGKYTLTYAKKTRRFLIHKQNKSFDKFFIDSSLSNTQLCYFGKKYPTNKSPLNENGHRSSFTGIYTLLFSSLKNKKINIAEIGIEKNNSTKVWRNYFEKAKIYTFEFDKKKILKAKKDRLRNTFYFEVDVTNRERIRNSFKKTKNMFDIVIDDSTHIFEDQINIVKETYKFLKKDGILVIEDIYKYVGNYKYLL